MKYLSDYTEKAQTKAFEDNGAFFAFSNEQLKEKAVTGVKYVSCGSGLICPKENVDTLIESLENIQKESIKMDIEENGLEAIIKRELANYECYYTGDIEDAVQALSDYDGITAEMIRDIYQGSKHAA